MMHKAWHSIKEVPYCFFRSSIKFPGHMGQKINDLNPILSKNTRPVAAIKSLRFALIFNEYLHVSIEISLKFVPQCPINDKPALVHIMAWYETGDKPLSGQVFLICIDVSLGLNGYVCHRPCPICYTLYKALPLFATRFAACAGGIRVSFMQPCLI